MHRWEKGNEFQSVARPRDSIDTGLKHFYDKNRFDMDNCIHIVLYWFTFTRLFNWIILIYKQSYRGSKFSLQGGSSSVYSI